MNKDIERVLVSQEEIEKRVSDIASHIEKDFEGKEITLIAVLNGSVVLVSDLMRKIKNNLTVNFMKVSSYGSSTESAGNVKIVKDLDCDIEGKDILIVEDIIDSGVTMSYLLKMFWDRRPNSIKVCTLLNKPGRRRVEVPVDYIGFDIPDEFVIGYGLDYDEKYRNLPYIGILKRSVYE